MQTKLDNKHPFSGRAKKMGFVQEYNPSDSQIWNEIHQN